jgi:hypothetical protein
VVVERVVERAVMEEWTPLVSGMAAQVLELNKTLEEQMTGSHGCPMIFPRPLSQTHPSGGYRRIKSKR